jgi:transposase
VSGSIACGLSPASEPPTCDRPRLSLAFTGLAALQGLDRALQGHDFAGKEILAHKVLVCLADGETPVLQYHFNWKTISVTAAMTLWNFYFQIFEQAIAKELVVDFLAHLVQQLAGPLLIVWDRLPAHRSRLVAEFVEFLQGQILLEYLPAYAPELNPVEYLWGHWKHYELPNVCPNDLWQLSEGPAALCSDRAAGHV